MAKKILIVDDYKDSRHFMKFLLEGCGFEVLEARDGVEAIEKNKREQPNLILMDLSMPVLDALSATKSGRVTLKLKGCRLRQSFFIDTFRLLFTHFKLSAGFQNH